MTALIPGRSKILLAALLVAAATACGCGGRRGGFQMPPVPVEVANVVSQTVTDRFRAVGTIEAEETVRIVNEIPGVVRELPFAEGQPVQKGALLARLDDAELGAEAARAEALRDQSRTNHERVRQLFEQKAASPQELDDAVSALKVAEANATVARTHYDKAHIRSPLSGVVGRRLVSPGAYLPVGTEITEVASIGMVKVIFSAPERYVPQLKRRAAVTVSSTAYPGQAFTGTIGVVDPILDPASHTVQMVAHIRNRGGMLRAGMSADVTASLGERPQALTVPDEAVFSEGDQFYVYVVKPDSTVTRQAVTLGLREATRAEVTQGLKAGDRVVSAGYQKLFEGAHVMPMPSTDAGADGATGAVASPPPGGARPAPAGGATPAAAKGTKR